MGEWVAIVNLRSGGRARPATFARDLESAVSRVLVSERPGHVDALVRSCSNAAGILVAGGDGTLFEVLQACDRSRQKIALLPAGRGNSLAKDLGIGKDADARTCIERGVDLPVDLLAVTLDFDDGTRWTGVSASNLAIGYPAAVARNAARWRWLRGGSYALAALTASPKPFDVRLRRDGAHAETIRLTGFIISNSRYVGPFMGFPASKLSDGVFHTIEMRSGRVRQAVHNVSSLTGLGFYEPGVRRDVRSVDARFDAPALLKIDGEIRSGVIAIEARVERGAVTFRVPPLPHA
jgi:diacylglycerol kinase (ATP)